MNCFLRQLSRNFSNNLIGLNISDEGEASTWTDAFTCCKEKDLHSIKNFQGIHICDLENRLKKINAILEQHKTTWQKPFAYYKQRNHSEVSDFITRYREDEEFKYKGLVSCSKTSKKEPSSILWLIAITAIWRFGIDVHFVSLGKSQAQDLLPKTPTRDLLVLVEQKETLRFPQTAFDLNTLVNWCEGAMIPLWIDVFYENNSKASTSSRSNLNIKEGFKKRTARYLSAPPLSWLDQDCISRLRNVCFNYERYC